MNGPTREIREQWRMPGLGRRAVKDGRDHLHLMAAPPVPITRLWRHWFDDGWWGDQQTTSQCVGYAWAHFVEDAPRIHPAAGPLVIPQLIYTEARKVDEWDGEDYEGTSVRAGAKVLQAMRVIGEYRWAFDVDTVASTVLEVGPVVMGTNWYRAMFEPDKRHVVHLDGPVVGGHAYVINGFSRVKQLFRAKNSWGRGYGNNGHFYLRHGDVARLLAEDGEACIASELV